MTVGSRRIMAGALAGVLVLAACGEDEKASEEYLDALSASFLATDDGPPLATDEEQARCAAEEVTDALGQSRLEEVGLTIEVLTSPTLTKTGLDLDDDEALEIADAIIVCTDFGAVFAREFATGLGAAAPNAECTGEELAGSGALRVVLASALRLGAKQGMSQEAAAGMFDVMADCGALGQLFAAGLAEEGVVLDEQEIQCVNDSLAADQGARGALVRSFTGEATPDESIELLLPSVTRCVPLDRLAG